MFDDSLEGKKKKSGSGAAEKGDSRSRKNPMDGGLDA